MPTPAFFPRARAPLTRRLRATRARLPEPSVERLRVAVTALFVLDGAIFGSWAARVPGVAAQVGAAHSALGVALLCLSLGALVAMRLTGRLVRPRGCGSGGRGGRRRPLPVHRSGRASPRRCPRCAPPCSCSAPPRVRSTSPPTPSACRWRRRAGPAGAVRAARRVQPRRLGRCPARRRGSCGARRRRAPVAGRGGRPRSSPPGSCRRCSPRAAPTTGGAPCGSPAPQRPPGPWSSSVRSPAAPPSVKGPSPTGARCSCGPNRARR